MSGRQPDTAEIERRFSGLARLYGDQGAQRIRSAHHDVLVQRKRMHSLLPTSAFPKRVKQRLSGFVIVASVG